MNILKSMRNSVHDRSGDADSRVAGSSDASEPLIARYEGLNERDAVAELSQLNQVDLTAIEAFERSHRDRQAVLNKLRYLRQGEPLPGYDALDADGVGDALSGADAETVKAAREYERKLRDRPAALKAITAALHKLPTRPSAPVDLPFPAASHEQQVVGNGLPIKVKPESGIGA